MPKELCSVQYNDIDHAIKNCGKFRNKSVFWAKTDIQMAFRVVPICVNQRFLLLMKAVNPINFKTQYFIEKNLAFGSSISCSHFQRLSNAIRHIVDMTSGTTGTITNYLDDYLMVSDSQEQCSRIVQQFMMICDEIKLPIVLEKTEWLQHRVVFLGILLNGCTMTMSIPEKKRSKALRMVRQFQLKRKATVREIQILAGILNFLTRAIHPGRPFLRRVGPLDESKSSVQTIH